MQVDFRTTLETGLSRDQGALACPNTPRQLTVFALMPAVFLEGTETVMPLVDKPLRTRAEIYNLYKISPILYLLTR